MFHQSHTASAERHRLIFGVHFPGKGPTLTGELSKSVHGTWTANGLPTGITTEVPGLCPSNATIAEIIDCLPLKSNYLQCDGTDVRRHKFSHSKRHQ